MPLGLSSTHGLLSKKTSMNQQCGLALLNINREAVARSLPKCYTKRNFNVDLNDVILPDFFWHNLVASK